MNTSKLTFQFTFMLIGLACLGAVFYLGTMTEPLIETYTNGTRVTIPLDTGYDGAALAYGLVSAVSFLVVGKLEISKTA